jgi:heme A synthase
MVSRYTEAGCDLTIDAGLFFKVESMWVIEFHRVWAYVCIAAGLILGVYSGWRLWRHGTVDQPLRGLLALSEVTYLVQGVLGMVLVGQGLVPGKGWVHALYGIVILTTIPVAYFFSRGRDDRRVVTVYMIVGFFLAGVAVRALLTGIP